MRAQQECLRQALDENKWYLSERAGRDVGHDRAMDDFFEAHLDRVAHEFRLRFCRTLCQARGECELARGVEHLSSSSQAHQRLRPRGPAAHGQRGAA